MSDYCKECIKMYEDSDCFLQYKKAMKNKYFMFECLKCEKIVYRFISNFPTMLEQWKKHLENLFY